MNYFAPPRSKTTKHHRVTWGSASYPVSQLPVVLQWEPYMDDKVRERTNGHVVTFANREMRDKWLAAMHPTLHSKRKHQNTSIAMAEGKGLK